MPSLLAMKITSSSLPRYMAQVATHLVPLVNRLFSHYQHDDVIKWKHFPRYWPFVRGIHRSRWNNRTKASDAELWCFLWSAPEKNRLSKQLWDWWFETPPWSLWRQCNDQHVTKNTKRKHYCTLGLQLLLRADIESGMSTNGSAALKRNLNCYWFCVVNSPVYILITIFLFLIRPHVQNVTLIRYVKAYSYRV